jgi:hypothetical protein
MLGSDGHHASVKATQEQQAELVASDPEVYGVAAHVGRFGWVSVDVARADAGELAELLEDAWRRTAPRALVKAFDERD